MDTSAFINALPNKDLNELFDLITGTAAARIRTTAQFRFKQTVWINTTDTDDDGNPETYDVNFILHGRLHSTTTDAGIDIADVQSDDVMKILQQLRG